MLFDDIRLSEQSQITNLTVASGTDFPANPSGGELFYKTSATVGLYLSDGVTWSPEAASGRSTFTITGDLELLAPT